MRIQRLNTIIPVRDFRWGLNRGGDLERNVMFVGRQNFLVRVCELLTIWQNPWDGVQLGHINQAWLDIH